MKKFTIDNKKYYLWTDLKKTYPNLFTGCKNANIYITKKNVSSKNYIFAKLTNNKWTISDGSSKKFDKIFILESWFEKTYPDDENVKEIEKKDNIELAPQIIDLEDHEKFTDNDGNIIEIEVRGERDYDNCYFKVSDIMKGFNSKNLNTTITNDGGYKKNIHYKCFLLDRHILNGNGTIKKLFLTYTGLLKVLFASRKGNAEKFVNWASKTLFIAQMGTTDQRNELVSNLLGVSVKSVKEVFNKTANSIPCIYLFSIGKVKNLKKSLQIDKKYKDDDFVYKWGMTDSLARRTDEHRRSFGKIKGTELELVQFGLIDPQHISKAESKIKNIFNGMDLVLEHDTFTELAIIPSNKMKIIKEQYSLISTAYMGHIKELVEKIKEKDSEIKLLNETHLKELAIKDNQLLLKDNQLLQKDLDIANIKLKKK